MQEEIEHKTVNLAISTTKLSARTLLRGMQFLLRQYGSSAGGCSRRCKRAALPAVSESSCAEQSATCSRQAHKRRST